MPLAAPVDGESEDNCDCAFAAGAVLSAALVMLPDSLFVAAAAEEGTRYSCDVSRIDAPESTVRPSPAQAHVIIDLRPWDVGGVLASAATGLISSGGLPDGV